MMLSVTKIFNFEAGHALSNHEGQCRNIHGHSYKLHVTVTGDKLNNGILIDFKDLKGIVENGVISHFDHALLLKHNELNINATKNLQSKICWMDEEPTVEFLVCHIGDKIKEALSDNVKLLRLKLYETESCYAELTYPGI